MKGVMMSHNRNHWKKELKVYFPWEHTCTVICTRAQTKSMHWWKNWVLIFSWTSLICQEDIICLSLQILQAHCWYWSSWKLSLERTTVNESSCFLLHILKITDNRSNTQENDSWLRNQSLTGRIKPVQQRRWKKHKSEVCKKHLPLKFCFFYRGNGTKGK